MSVLNKCAPHGSNIDSNIQKEKESVKELDGLAVWWEVSIERKWLEFWVYIHRFHALN